MKVVCILSYRRKILNIYDGVGGKLLLDAKYNLQPSQYKLNCLTNQTIRYDGSINHEKIKESVLLATDMSVCAYDMC